MSAKYFKRGTREYYQVTPERITRIINKNSWCQVTFADSETMDIILADAKEGVEIPRSEFEQQFNIAANLIVLEP